MDRFKNFKDFRERAKKNLEENRVKMNAEQIKLEVEKHKAIMEQKAESERVKQEKKDAERRAEIERAVELERTKLEADYNTKLERVMHENEMLRMRVRELEMELSNKTTEN